VFANAIADSGKGIYMKINNIQVLDNPHIDKLCVIIPSYNEEGAITDVLIKWISLLNKLDINYTIRIYDASHDKTPVILEKFDEKNKSIQ
jgi:hypothetical protein